MRAGTAFLKGMGIVAVGEGGIVLLFWRKRELWQ